MTPLPARVFCEQLFTNGMLTAAPWEPAHAAEAAGIEQIIRRADQTARLDAPATAPPLDLQAAQWALSALAWSVALLVDRANTSTSLPQQLVDSQPSGDTAQQHWSVDLAFRYLSEVFLRARAMASEDALVPELGALCSRWPLTIVGTQIPWNETSGQIILEDECLRRVLLDRIAARRDKRLRELPLLKRYIEV